MGGVIENARNRVAIYGCNTINAINAVLRLGSCSAMRGGAKSSHAEICTPFQHSWPKFSATVGFPISETHTKKQFANEPEGLR